MEYAPIAVLAIMICALLFTRTTMITACPIAALVILDLAGQHSSQLISQAAPSIATVLVVMTTTQLAIQGMLQDGAGDRISVRIAALASHRWLRRVPATVLLPAIFIPAAMFLAMFLHNITAILVLTPLAISMAVRYQVNPTTTLSGMLIASNLGGASMAFGDTPAIIQRTIWGFTPGTFAAAMLPRNLAVLVVLTAVACLVTWYPERKRQTSWLETLKRLQARDEMAACSQYSGAHRRQARVGLIALLAFIGLQFIFPKGALVTGCLALAALILFVPEHKKVDAYTALGLEAIIVIVALFVVAVAVEHTPVVQQVARYLQTNNGVGIIESGAYFLTGGISADGAAATLAKVVHQGTNGSMFSAWQLACGICAGSSMLLTAASAGPILNAVSKSAGHELTFKAYSPFGLGFSAVMMGIYLVFNTIAAS